MKRKARKKKKIRTKEEEEWKEVEIVTEFFLMLPLYLIALNDTEEFWTLN